MQGETLFNSVDATPILEPIHVCLWPRKNTCLFIGVFIHAEATAVFSGQNQPLWPRVDLFLQVLQGSKLPFFDSNQFNGVLCN